MTWNRDENAWKDKAELRNTIACRALGGRLKNDLESWWELMEGQSWIEEHHCAQGFGGKFKKWLGIVIRILGRAVNWGLLLHVDACRTLAGLKNDAESSTMLFCLLGRSCNPWLLKRNKGWLPSRDCWAVVAETVFNGVGHPRQTVPSLSSAP